jgi:hypothetical protein
MPQARQAKIATPRAASRMVAIVHEKQELPTAACRALSTPGDDAEAASPEGYRTWFIFSGRRSISLFDHDLFWAR